MVGAAGFEPTTSCAQGRRATKLRYAPMGRVYPRRIEGVNCCSGRCGRELLASVGRSGPEGHLSHGTDLPGAAFLPSFLRVAHGS